METMNGDGPIESIESGSFPPSSTQEEQTTSQKLPSNVMVVDYDLFYEPGGFEIALSNSDNKSYIEIIPKISLKHDGSDEATAKGTNNYNYRQYFEMNHFYDSAKGYDDNDPFIDNEDAYEDVMNPHFDTQYGGFYVNSGPLILKSIHSNEAQPEKSNKRSNYKKKSKHQSDEMEVALATYINTPTKKNSKPKNLDDPPHINENTNVNDKKKIRKRKINSTANATTNQVTEVLSGTPKKNIKQHSLAGDSINNDIEKIASPNELLLVKEKSHSRPPVISTCDQTVELPDYLPADYKNIVLEIAETIKNIPETFDDAEFNKKWVAFCYFLQNRAFKSKAVILKYIVSKTGISKGGLILQISKCLTDDIVTDMNKHFGTIKKAISSLENPTMLIIAKVLLCIDDYYLFIDDLTKIGAVSKFCGKTSPSNEIESDMINSFAELCPENISKNELKKNKSVAILKNLAFKFGASTVDISKIMETVTPISCLLPKSPSSKLPSAYDESKSSSSSSIVSSSVDPSQKKFIMMLPNNQMITTTPEQMKNFPSISDVSPTNYHANEPSFTSSFSKPINHQIDSSKKLYSFNYANQINPIPKVPSNITHACIQGGGPSMILNQNAVATRFPPLIQRENTIPVQQLPMHTQNYPIIESKANTQIPPLIMANSKMDKNELGIAHESPLKSKNVFPSNMSQNNAKL